MISIPCLFIYLWEVMWNNGHTGMCMIMFVSVWYFFLYLQLSFTGSIVHLQVKWHHEIIWEQLTQPGSVLLLRAVLEQGARRGPHRAWRWILLHDGIEGNTVKGTWCHKSYICSIKLIFLQASCPFWLWQVLMKICLRSNFDFSMHISFSYSFSSLIPSQWFIFCLALYL